MVPGPAELSYGDTFQSWHDFYVTAGAAAATLVGLLFVGLSLHIKVVVSHPDVRSLARVTLTDFFGVMLVALVILAPTGNAQTEGVWMIAIGAVSFVIVVRPAVEGIRMSRTRAIGARVLVSRFGLSALGYAGLVVIGGLFSRGEVRGALGGLLIVVVVLLTVAVRNTWDLLVTVADRPDGRRT